MGKGCRGLSLETEVKTVGFSEEFACHFPP